MVTVMSFECASISTGEKWISKKGDDIRNHYFCINVQRKENKIHSALKKSNFYRKE
jgi:hypothetical protein